MQYDGPGASGDLVTRMVVNPSGHAIVTGLSLGSDAEVYCHATPSHSSPLGVFADSLGQVFVAGQTVWDDWSRTYTAIRYGQAQSTTLPEQVELLQSFPNPSKGSTTIRYRVPEPGHVTLRVHNILGQQVATLVHGYRFAGEHEVIWEPQTAASGIYLYRLQSAGSTETARLLLIR